MKTCINCGKKMKNGKNIVSDPILKELLGCDVYLCDACNKLDQAMEKQLKNGIELEYTDGSKEIIKK